MTRRVDVWRAIARLLRAQGYEMSARFIELRIEGRADRTLVTLPFRKEAQDRIVALEAQR